MVWKSFLNGIKSITSVKGENNQVASKMNGDLQNRLFSFSIQVIQLVRKLLLTVEYKIICRQLIKSATSVGANYEESQAAVSKADSINKVGISLKEVRESNYWIRILIEIYPDKNGLITLKNES